MKEKGFNKTINWVMVSLVVLCVLSIGFCIVCKKYDLLDVTQSVEDTMQMMIIILTCAVICVIILLIYTNYTFNMNKRQGNMLDKIFLEAEIVSVDIDEAFNIVNGNNEWDKITGSHVEYKDKKKIYEYMPKDSWSKKSFNDMDENFEMPLTDSKGEVSFFLWSVVAEREILNTKVKTLLGINITERVNNEEKMHNLAYTDKLTGLPNRTFIDENMDIYLRKFGNCVVLSMDIDNFKYINDTYGHAAGNELLKCVVTRIKRVTTESEIIARTGGDEFMIISDRYDENTVHHLAGAILNSFEESFDIEGNKFNVSGSIGVAIYPEHGRNRESIIMNSDTALNMAKQEGRKRFVLYDISMQEAILNQLETEEGLKNAIINNEFVLYYQPQYQAGTGELYGFEALIRWNHPQKGLLAPNNFISVAEETGLILPIGRWVVEEAARFSKKLDERGYKNLKVSVNASVRQLVEEDFAKYVLETTNKIGINPSNLKIEITESLLLDKDKQSNIDKVEAISNNGFEVALDDFGTGYSSLTYLQQLPISVLKIDKSFVDYILIKNDEANICYHIIQLAHSINLVVIAEGVESKEQFIWLRDNECDFIQGFVASKPLPEKIILDSLEKIKNYNVEVQK